MSDKIIRRVRKMLALAHDSGAAENERENALRMAHATLAKHNLSMAALVLEGREEAEERVRDSVETRGWTWTRGLAQDIGKLFFCDGYFINLRNSKHRHYFVGLQSNVITAQEITAFVVASIVKEANARRRLAQEDHSYFLSFCKGASIAVRNKCYDLRTAQDAERFVPGSPGMSLVLASVYATQEAANKKFLEGLVSLVDVKSRERGASHGFSEGREFGDTIPLHKQVNSGRRQLT